MNEKANEKLKIQSAKLKNSTVFSFQLLVLSFFMFALAAGCENASRPTPALAIQIEGLSREKIQLQNQLEQSKTENELLKKQIETLAALPKNQRELWSIQRIEIGRLSGLHDDDKDGKKEKLIVYVQPIDQDGDSVKSPGEVQVQLWDLNKKGDQALVAEWHIGPAELKKLWLTALTSWQLQADVRRRRQGRTIQRAFDA